MFFRTYSQNKLKKDVYDCINKWKYWELFFFRGIFPKIFLDYVNTLRRTGLV